MSQPLIPERSGRDKSTIFATANYRLSERGRRHALLTGCDAEARQQVQLTVPAEDADLLRITPHGAAVLALTPRYEVLADGRYVKFDDPPIFDAVPTPAQLLEQARIAHTIRQAVYARRNAEREEREESWRRVRKEVAERFLADPTARAVADRPLNEHVCSLARQDGAPIKFHHTEPIPGGQVPAEAHRRHKADLVARRATGQAKAAANQARSGERREAIAAWVEAHGTLDQQQRSAAGVLPASEVVRAMTDAYLAPIAAAYAVYQPIRLADLQARFDVDPAWRTVRISPFEFSVEIQDLASAQPHHWAAMQEIQLAVPGASVVLRRDRAHWSGDSSGRAPTIVRYALRITLSVGPITLKRIVAAPERAAPKV